MTERSVFDEIEEDAPETEPPPRRGRPPGSANKKPKAAAREDTIHISGQFRAEVGIAIQEVILKRRKRGDRATVQSILAEGLNAVFLREDMPKIAAKTLGRSADQ